eukprot:CAMPEP_0171786688 /NCGR_PEP_ID=MMETSP0991-20121206/63451_1 /TAXON_ID=483369 /ORGANISM="non described non described, Strain CCMP2098" /LENGTH=32 /DNA_ID= /DNA_START= /DNA_END= /DNA_ORIENTATION=
MTTEDLSPTTGGSNLEINESRYAEMRTLRPQE